MIPRQFGVVALVQGIVQGTQISLHQPVDAVQPGELCGHWSAPGRQVRFDPSTKKPFCDGTHSQAAAEAVPESDEKR
jgi:hypothetical protein